MLLGIDGKILHLKELGFVEQMLFDEILSPKKFYKDFGNYLTNNYNLDKKEYFSIEDLIKVDDYVKDYLNSKIQESKAWLLRAYIIGRYLSYTDLTGKIFEIGNISKLPRMVIDAAQKYGLSIEEANALHHAIEQSASLMSNTTESTIQTIRQILTETTKQRGDAKTVLDKLKDTVLSDVGEINRDWQRTAISEVNSMFNNGYLAMMNPGEFVVGLSMPDACDSCLELINGKVYRLRSNPAEDYSNLNPASEEYQKLAEVWENEVWVGKNNFGRSSSKRKRIDPTIGNKADNLREKHHHEHSVPAIPLHARCRCRWIHFNPKFQYIDKDGQIRLRVENEEAWSEFYYENIYPITGEEA